MRTLAIVGCFLVAVALSFVLLGGFDMGKSSAGDSSNPSGSPSSSDPRDVNAPAHRKTPEVEYMVPCPNCKKRK